MKALFTQRFGPENMKKITDLGVDITYLPENRSGEVLTVSDFDFMVCFDPFRHLKFEGRCLRWIQLTSKGIAHVPSFLREREITFTNNLNASATPIAETVLSYILFFYKNFSLFLENKEKKLWKPDTGLLELSDKTVLFLGTGEIAKATASLLLPFHCTITGFNTNGRPVSGFQTVYDDAHLKNALEEADIVISCLPSTEKTFHLLNRDTFGYMKQDAVLINISRGSVLDENALVAYLDKGCFKGVALDVFEKEPLPENSPLWEYERLFITPHSSYFSDRFRERLFAMIYENVKRFLSGEVLLNVVDFSKGY